MSIINWTTLSVLWWSLILYTDSIDHLEGVQFICGRPSDEWRKKMSEESNRLQVFCGKAHWDIFCPSIVVIQTVQLLYLNHYCVRTFEFCMIQQACNQRCRAMMHRRDSFESPLISEGSLFTFPAAAGQINRLERGESLYTYKNAGPVGREFGRKLLKLLLSTL